MKKINLMLKNKFLFIRNINFGWKMENQIRFFVKKISILLAVFALLVHPVVFSQVIPDKKTCKECHTKVTEFEVVHAPVNKKCDRCHTSNENEHPKEKVIGFTLSERVPALCYSCHDEIDTKPIIHKPIKEGKCFECHATHSSPNTYLLLKDPPSALCVKCHEPSKTVSKVVHKPYQIGECNKCHEPHSSDHKGLLKSKSPQLCLSCHKKEKELVKADHIHPPFGNDCLICHKPHESREEKLLDMKPVSLCFHCHDDTKKAIDKAPFKHGAATEKKACLNCHSPHASSHKMYLLSETKQLCLSCHDKSYTKNGKKIANIGEELKNGKKPHEAIEKAGCTGCHDPHASAHTSLLTKKYPSGSYAPGLKENFALCFECHKSELFEKAVTTTATGFRNGNKNLHFVHINGEKGRNCSLCHHAHASENDFLLKDKTYFGNWEMPVKFIKMEKGGSCSPGCHTEKKYER
jgi:predicted CXXCH cytochrome family protein